MNLVHGKRRGKLLHHFPVGKAVERSTAAVPVPQEQTDQDGNG
jgi:hypothetical protein